MIPILPIFACLLASYVVSSQKERKKIVVKSFVLSIPLLT